MEFASTTIVSTLATIHLASASINLVGIIASWFLLSIFGFAMGGSRLDALAFACIAATLLRPFTANAIFLSPLLVGISPFSATIAVIAGLLIVCYLAGLRLCDTGFVDEGGLIASALSALAIVAIVLALWNSAYTMVWPFPIELAPVFGTQFTLWWLLGGIAVLAFARQQRL